mgnify:CR=1 FL=1
MKPVKLILTVLIFLLSTGLVTAEVNYVPPEVRAVLARYFDALSQGDTRTLKSLMGPGLLERRIRLLDNPTYPGYLAETFGQARFNIVGYSETEEGLVVDVSILLPGGNNDDRLEKRLILIDESRGGDSSRLLIEDERTPEPAGDR